MAITAGETRARLSTMLSIITIGGVSYLLLRKCSKSSGLRASASNVLETFKREPAINAREATGEFHAQQMFNCINVSSNAHGASAAARGTCVTFVRQFISTLGRSEYSLSMGHRDLDRGVHGQRLWFWGKDTDKKVTMDCQDDRILSAIDVDYHVEQMHDLITGSSTPIVFSTVNPTKVAESSGEATYHFSTDNVFNMRLPGSSYTHKLWDYSPDVVKTTKSFLGITYAMTVFKVEKRQVNDLLQIVLLSPLGTWTGFTALLADWILESPSLTRFNPVHQGWAHIATTTKTGVLHSLGKAGTSLEATFTEAEFELCMSMARRAKGGVRTSTFSPLLSHDRDRAIVMADYALDQLPSKPAYATKVADGVRQISSSVNTYQDDDEKEGVKAFMQPLVAGGCYAHTNTRDNGAWAVEARITNLKKEAKPLSTFATDVVLEFVSLMTEQGPLVPLDFEDVLDACKRPTQRALAVEGGQTGSHIDNTVKSFVKKEAIQGIKDPRVISTLPPLTKMEYSRYMRPVGDHLKQYNWYAFKTPVEVAERIGEMLSGKPYALEGDFSRMDGNVDENVRRILEHSLLRRWFPDDTHVIKLHSKQFCQAGVIAGHAYEGGYARCSGSPETSAFNTILTACVVFLKNRMLGLSPLQAFASIGIVGGDDSLIPGIRGVSPSKDAWAFRSAATALGQTLTSDIKLPGTPVTMLSRIFGEAWDGNGNSMCSPLRTLVKLHSSANMPGGVTNEMKCHEKGLSLLLTDKETPIICHIATKMISTGEPIPAKFRDLACSHWSGFENSWPNEHAEWMEDVFTEQLPDFDHVLFERWIFGGDVLEAPTMLELFDTTPGKIDVLVDGILVPSTSSAPATLSEYCDSSVGVNSRAASVSSKAGSRTPSVRPAAESKTTNRSSRKRKPKQGSVIPSV